VVSGSWSRLQTGAVDYYLLSKNDLKAPKSCCQKFENVIIRSTPENRRQRDLYRNVRVLAFWESLCPRTITMELRIVQLAFNVPFPVSYPKAKFYLPPFVSESWDILLLHHRRYVLRYGTHSASDWPRYVPKTTHLILYKPYNEINNIQKWITFEVGSHQNL
jgi:hypothetical protein